MVKSLKQRFSNIDATFLIALVIAIALTILATWFMASYVLNEIIQGLLYPYSDYPVIVSSSVDILILPAWAVMCLAVLIGISDVLLDLTEKPFFDSLKKKLGLAVGIMLVVSVVTLVANYVTWQVAARSNGYIQCVSGSKLLIGSKTSSVWSKEEYLCYNRDVDRLLPTGTHEQVLKVTEYLNKD